MIERDLVAACKKGERKAQEILYLLFSEKMFGVCRGYTSNAEDAKDVLQDGFIKVFESIHHFNFEGTLEAWVRRIFVNTAIDRYRKNLNLTKLTVAIGYEANEVIDESRAEEIDAQLFLDIIRDLPDGCRIIFNLHVIEGYKHREIAQMLNISEGTSKSQVHEAKRILQRKLKRIYPTAVLIYATGALKLVSG